VVPENVIILRLALFASLASLDSPEVQNGELAILDELIGNLDEQTSHPLIGVVVTSNGVDHLDTVHQSWQSFLNALGVSFVERLNEFLEGLQVLDIVFGFVESLSDSQLNSLPL